MFNVTNTHPHGKGNQCLTHHHMYGHIGDRQKPGAARESHVFWGVFMCMQSLTVLHTTKPFDKRVRPQGVNPEPSDHESLTVCMSPPSKDC